MRYSKTIIPASYWKRFIALIIDITIINIFLVFPFRKFFIDKLPQTSSFTDAMAYFESNPEITGSLSFIIFIISFFAWIYLTVSEWKLNATAGDMLMKIRIKSNSSKELRLWQASLRNLFIFPYFPFIALWIIDPVYLLFKQQKFSEFATKTDTIEEFVIDKAKVYQED